MSVCVVHKGGREKHQMSQDDILDVIVQCFKYNLNVLSVLLSISLFHSPFSLLSTALVQGLICQRFFPAPLLGMEKREGERGTN